MLWAYLDKLKHIFSEVFVSRAVFDEVCVKGRGLTGERELFEADNYRTFILFP